MGRYFKDLLKLEGAVKPEAINPHLNVARSPSPSFNWIFGNGQGLPYGYSAILFGPPKNGKSAVANLMIGQLHKDDPTALAVKFNTEMREEGQSSTIWGIDDDRYIAFDTNKPEEIFDRIENEIAAIIEKGENIKMIVIDSITGITGLKMANADSVAQHLVGDHAQTIQNGLKRILPTIRRKKIALLLTSHVRANLEMNGGHGPKTKMAGAFGLQHFAEYFIEVKINNSTEGKKDFLGTEMENKEISDVKGNNDKTGKRIFVKMAQSSVGVEGRTGEFLFDFYEGIKDQWAEIATIGANTGIVTHPASKSGEGVNLRMWQFEDKIWPGWDAFLLGVKNDPELQGKILRASRELDLVHILPKKA